MEVIKRKVGYEDIGRTMNLVVTATTLNFPFMLKQSFEDIGIYTDTENPVYEIVDLSGLWDLSNNGNGQKPCLALNNCSATITSTPISYYGGSDGTISATISPGCPAPQTYSWTGPNGYTATNVLNLSSLKTGNYTLKITDANCDFSYVSYYLQQPQALYNNVVAGSSQTNALIGCNGTATTIPGGGQPPYTYTWYSGATIIAGPSTTLSGITGLCAGVYTVQVQDASNTIVSNTFVITEPSAVSGTVVTTGNVDCNGGNTGSIILSAAGGIAPTGYTYILTGPTGVTNTTGSFFNLPACPTPSPCYSATIYDGVGNFTTVGPISITQPVAINFGSSKTNVTCYESDNGTIYLTPSGGVAPYTINLYRTPDLIETITTNGPIAVNDLSVGNYYATITDGNGCVGPQANIGTIYQRPNLTMSTITLPNNNGYNISCFGGTISPTVSVVYVTDGTTISPWVPAVPLTYPMEFYVDNVLVTTANALSAAVPMSAGVHTIKVVDSAGCSVETTNVNVTQPPQLYIVGGIDYIEGLTGCTGCGPMTGCRQAIIDVTGGVGPYTISWYMMPGFVSWGTGITSNRYCASEGSYTSLNVTVTDGNGCIVTDSILV